MTLLELIFIILAVAFFHFVFTNFKYGTWEKQPFRSDYLAKTAPPIAYLKMIGWYIVFGIPTAIIIYGCYLLGTVDLW